MPPLDRLNRDRDRTRRWCLPLCYVSALALLLHWQLRYVRDKISVQPQRAQTSSRLMSSPLLEPAGLTSPPPLPPPPITDEAQLRHATTVATAVADATPPSTTQASPPKGSDGAAYTFVVPHYQKHHIERVLSERHLTWEEMESRDEVSFAATVPIK